MPKYYCEYCDIFLAHSSFFGRKQHCTGRKHIQNKIENRPMHMSQFLTAVHPYSRIWFPEHLFPAEVLSPCQTLSYEIVGSSSEFYSTDLIKEGIIHAPNYDGTPEAESSRGTMVVRPVPPAAPSGFGPVTYPSAEPPVAAPAHPYAFGKGFGMGKGIFFGKGFGGALPMPPVPGSFS